MGGTLSLAKLVEVLTDKKEKMSVLVRCVNSVGGIALGHTTEAEKARDYLIILMRSDNPGIRYATYPYAYALDEEGLASGELHDLVSAVNIDALPEHILVFSKDLRAHSV